MWRILLLTTSLLIGVIQAQDPDGAPRPTQIRIGLGACKTDVIRKFKDTCIQRLERGGVYVILPDESTRFTPNICTNKFKASDLHQNSKRWPVVRRPSEVLAEQPDDLAVEQQRAKAWPKPIPDLELKQKMEREKQLEQSMLNECLFQNVRNITRGSSNPTYEYDSYSYDSYSYDYYYHYANDGLECVADIYDMMNHTSIKETPCEEPNEGNTVQIVDRKGHINDDYSVPNNWSIDKTHIVKLYQSLVNADAFTSHDIIYTVASYLSEVLSLGHEKLKTLPKLQMHTDIILYLAKLRVNWKDESLSAELQNVMLSFLNDVYLNSISICDPRYVTPVDSTKCIDVHAIVSKKTNVNAEQEIPDDADGQKNVMFENFKAAMNEESCKVNKDLLFRDTRWSCWAEIAANMVELEAPTSDGTDDANKDDDFKTFFEFNHSSYVKEDDFEDDFEADFGRKTNKIMKDICADENFDYRFLNEVTNYWGKYKTRVVPNTVIDHWTMQDAQAEVVAEAEAAAFVLLVNNTAQCGEIFNGAIQAKQDGEKSEQIRTGRSISGKPCKSSDDELAAYFEKCDKAVADKNSLQIINPEQGVRFTPNICTNKFNETDLHQTPSMLWECLYRNVKDDPESDNCVAVVYNMYEDSGNAETKTKYPQNGVSCEKPNEDNTVQIVDRNGHINVDYSVPDNWSIHETHIVKLYQSLVNTYAFTNHDIIYTVASYLSEVLSLGHEKLKTLPKLQMHTDIILYLAKLRVNWKDESLSVELQNVMLSFLNDVYLNSISICDPRYVTPADSTKCIDVHAIVSNKTNVDAAQEPPPDGQKFNVTFENFKAAMKEESCQDSKDLLFRDTRWSCWAEIAANMVELEAPTSDESDDTIKDEDFKKFFEFNHSSYVKEVDFEDDFEADFERKTKKIMEEICADETFDYKFLNKVTNYWGQYKSGDGVNPDGVNPDGVNPLFVLLVNNTAQCGEIVFGGGSVIFSASLALAPIAMVLSFLCAKTRTT